MGTSVPDVFTQNDEYLVYGTTASFSFMDLTGDYYDFCMTKLMWCMLYAQALFESRQYSNSAAESCLPSLQWFLWSPEPTFLCLHELITGSILSHKKSALALTSVLVLSSHLGSYEYVSIGRLHSRFHTTILYELLTSPTLSIHLWFSLLYRNVVKSRDSWVGTAIGYEVDGRGSIPGRSKRFPFLHSFYNGSGPTLTLIQWVPGTLSRVVNRQGREAERSPPSSAELKNGGAVPPLSRMPSCHII
jgi:hypothetical protein